jgi:hypothetical protein
MLRYIRETDKLTLVRDFVAWLVPDTLGKVLGFAVFTVLALVSLGIGLLRLVKVFS